VIFIDRSIPRSVARAFQLVRDDIRWLEDEFAHDVPDTTWLRRCGEEGWLVISRDKRIRTRPAEHRAIVEWAVGTFVITVGENLSRWQILQLLAVHLDEMERLFAADESRSSTRSGGPASHATTSGALDPTPAPPPAGAPA
jgi:hypothetical protein